MTAGRTKIQNGCEYSKVGIMNLYHESLFRYNELLIRYLRHQLTL